MNPCRVTARQQAGRNILTRTPTRRRLLASKLIDPAPVTRFHTRKFDVGTSLKMTTLSSSVRAPYNVATMLSKGLTSPMDTAIKNWASTSGSTTQWQASDGCTNLKTRKGRTVFSGEFSDTLHVPPGTTGATLALDKYSSILADVASPPASVTATCKPTHSCGMQPMEVDYRP
jgi:hypothetical protein